MAPEPLVPDRLYQAFLDQFLSGAFMAGTKIDLRQFARAHQVSITPVREVATRLMGEQLLERHSVNGFQISLPDEIGLIHLYAWFGQHVLAARHRTPPAALHQAVQGFRAIDRKAELTDDLAKRLDHVERTGALFLAIAAASGNQEFVGQIAAANHRLHYLRLAETHLFPDHAVELDRLISGTRTDVENNVRRRIWAYHRRRIEQAGQILMKAFDMPPSTENNDLVGAKKRR